MFGALAQAGPANCGLHQPNAIAAPKAAAKPVAKPAEEPESAIKASTLLKVMIAGMFRRIRAPAWPIRRTT